jgi:hypothetical protein
MHIMHFMAVEISKGVKFDKNNYLNYNSKDALAKGGKVDGKFKKIPNR